MIHLKLIRKREIPVELEEKFPFNTPVIRILEEVEFNTEVTLFVGDNGSGKSTLLEGIGAGCKLPIVGSNNMEADDTLRDASVLAKYLTLGWTVKLNKGFFLRAEDFFGFTKRLNVLRKELVEERGRLDRELPDGYGKQLAVGSISGQIDELTKRYGIDLNAGSHGESFLQLFQSRIKPGGLYLLDEPEAPLSPVKQMGLMLLIKEMVEQKCQFIIATHSPILMAYPGACIYNFNKHPLNKISFEEVEQVQILRGFLENKEEYLRQLGF